MNSLLASQHTSNDSSLYGCAKAQLNSRRLSSSRQRWGEGGRRCRPRKSRRPSKHSSAYERLNPEWGVDCLLFLALILSQCQQLPKYPLRHPSGSQHQPRPRSELWPELLKFGHGQLPSFQQDDDRGQNRNQDSWQAVCIQARRA